MQEEIADAGAFAQSETSRRIRIIHGELLAQGDLDAAVSFLSEDLSWGGPVNQKILLQTNHQVDTYVLNNVIRPLRGQAFATPAFNLPFQHLVFGVIAPWDTNFSGGERTLKRAVMSALEVAAQLGCRTVGLPALNGGPDRFPMRKGARIIANALKDSDLSQFETISIVCKSPEALGAYRERFPA